MLSTGLDEQARSLTCPNCGNVNVYAADRCLKCELRLGPIREALESARHGPAVAETSPPPRSEPKTDTEPAPPLPELPTRAQDQPTATYVDSSRFLIRGMGDRAGEIAARFFKQVADRGIEGLKLSLGKLIIRVDDQRSDSRDYYFAERVFADDARATMAVRIAPSGTDLFVEWRHYTTPGEAKRNKDGPLGWLMIGGLISIVGVALLFDKNAVVWGILLLLFGIPCTLGSLAGVCQSDTYRKDSLEGFQSQDSTAFQLSARAALEEAIDLAGISKELIQEVHEDDDKNRRVI